MLKFGMKNSILPVLALIACISCATDPSSRYPNMVADMDPFSLGTVIVFTDQLFSSKLKPQIAEVVFIPRENLVSLEYRHELVTYRQFWNYLGRQNFISGINQYKDDFSARKLDVKARYTRTRSIYGKIKSKLEWETFKFTTTYKSSPTMELGYRFRPSKGTTPYFTVLQRSAKDESGVMEDSKIESMQVSLYFTRAQGDILSGLFNQDNLLKAVATYGRGTAEPNAPAADVYTKESELEAEEEESTY